MRIVIVHSDRAARSTLCTMASQFGHSVLPFAQPRVALDRLPDWFDLLLSGVDLDGMDGFDLAERICSRMNGSAPLVLLVSGRKQCDFPEELLPRSVIGLIPRPPTAAGLERILHFVERTRHRCPGAAGSFCSCYEGHMDVEQETGRLAMCHTSAYTACPHYILCRRAVLPWLGPLGGTPADMTGEADDAPAEAAA